MTSNTTIRVRYQETDQMGVVYYGNYFTWFEVGRNEFFRDTSVEYRNLEKEGVYLPVVSTHCNYKQPARYDDNITISTSVAHLSSARIVFSYEICRESDGTKIADGETSHAFVSHEGRVISLKKHYPKIYNQLSEHVSV